MAHDFARFPELTNSQMQFYYWDSPHKQIFENFHAKVVEVHDGDTIKILWEERNFPFRIRLKGIAAPELKEKGGKESTDWLSDIILNEEVDVLIDRKNRVGKFGRLIGEIMFKGININKQSIMNGQSIDFNIIQAGQIKDPIKETWFRGGF